MSTCEKNKCNHGTPSDDQDQQVRERLEKIRNKLLVMSGKGGVGKSSVATCLSLGLSKLGYKVGLLDVDLHGPSIPRMLGISGIFRVDPKSGCMIPHAYDGNLQVVSIECLLEDRDSAVIWRGPVKHGVIKQFISDVQWGALDFLVIDSPPGTGDEPLSVAQTIPDAHAVIVTTPQEVALADVRKSINFCRKVHMPVLGLIENMSGLICQHCHRETPLFSKGGGLKTAAQMNVPFLGSLPFDPRVVEAGDSGRSLFAGEAAGPFIDALNQLITEIVERCGTQENSETMQPLAVESNRLSAQGGRMMSEQDIKVAVPLADGKLTNHFGHCERFALLDVKDGVIQRKEELTPPPHEPGVLPRWLGELNVNLIIAGGMGQRALKLFQERNIKVVTGAPIMSPEELVKRYLEGTLVTGANVCDH